MGSRVEKAEGELKQLLAKLKTDVEEADFCQIPVKNQQLSSLRIPNDIDHFRRERKLAMDKLMQVPGLRQVDVLAQGLKEELEVCGKMEYTSSSLAALLHQFYLNRIEQLVQCKLMHQMRWLRYGSTSQVIQRLQGQYKHRMQAIMSEFHDAVGRAQRLSACMEQLLAGGSPSSPGLVTLQDVLIYLRYTVAELHSFKQANAYLKVIQWLPYLHQNTMAMVHEKLDMSFSKSDHKEQVTASVRKRWQDAARRARRRSSVARPMEAAQSPYAIDSSKRGVMESVTDGTIDKDRFFCSSELAPPAGGAAMAIPGNTSDLVKLRPLLEHLMSCYGISMSAEFLSSADELELFYIVNRKFKFAFESQEEKLTFYTLGSSSEDLSDGGLDKKVFRKESAWLPYVKIRPERMQCEDTLIGKLRTEDYIDPLLFVLSHSLNLADIQKLQFALKRHAAEIRQDVGNTSSQHVGKTTAIWRNIFSGFDPHDPSFNLNSSETPPRTSQTRHQSIPSAGIHRLTVLGNGIPNTQSSASDFDFGSAVQLLDGKEGTLFGRKTASEAAYKDGFMSFLYLRHLRMRDFRIKCLSILNYFRSIQRTLTVNDSGVLLMASSEQASGQSAEFSGAPHLYNTPAECRLDWASVMESNEAEYCDDFYAVDDDGCLIVQNKEGCHIMYDSAIDDFRHLEHQMLLVGSYYIERATEKIFQKRNALVENQKSIDRFGVLFDLWNQECLYLEKKRKLLNCYLEAYHNVFDPSEKRALAQVMTNVMFARPRFGPLSDYFLDVYQDECLCLQLQHTLVVKILDKQIEAQRRYLERILPPQSSDPEEQFGLPLDVISQQLISLTDTRPALKPVYLLEFHPSLCLASRLPGFLSLSLDHTLHLFKIQTPTAAVKFHIQLLRSAHQEWDLMRDLGSDYTKAVQDSLFFDIICEDSNVLVKICLSLCERLQQHGQLTQAELQTQRMKVWTNVLELIQIRHHLIDVCHETSLLFKVYKRQTSDLALGLHNAFLRPVQLEQSAGVVCSSDPPQKAMGLSKQDDAALDRFSSSVLSLAVHEMDENQVGQFSFRSKAAIEQLLQREGIEKLQTVLKVQLATRAAFSVAVQQNSLCRLMAMTETKSEEMKLDEFTPEGEAQEGNMTTTVSKKSDSSGDLAQQLMKGISMTKHLQNYFISIQLLKTPVRQEAMELYSKKPAALFKDPKEQEKAKREAINVYSERLVSHLAQYALRIQIVAFLDSLRNLLCLFPSVRDAFFQTGYDPARDEQQQKKQRKKSIFGFQTATQSEEAQKPDVEILDDPRKVYIRPRQFMSADGQKLLNLWYLPHFAEVISMFSNLERFNMVYCLHTMLRIVSSLHTTVMFITTYAQLGDTCGFKLESKDHQGASWGGAERLGWELNDLQHKITCLSDPQDPVLVADYLELYCRLLFQEFYVAVAHNLRHNLLAMGLEGAYQDVTDGVNAFLKVAADFPRDILMLPLCVVPDPFIPSSKQTKDLFPHRSMFSRTGLGPCLVSERCRIGQSVYTCLSCLNQKGREVASGELMSVSLLLEDVLEKLLQESDLSPQSARFQESWVALCRRRMTVTSVVNYTSTDAQETKIEKAFLRSSSEATVGPRCTLEVLGFSLIDSTKHLLDFLILTSQLENLKQKWGQHVLGIQHCICTSKQNKIYEESYSVNVLEPVKHSLLASSAESAISEPRRSSSEVPEVELKMNGVTETHLRKAQVDSLLELLECHMIEDTKRRFNRLHDLVLAERLRDDDNLPFDLWKTVQTKEMCVVQRPLLVEEFSTALLSSLTDQGDSISFCKDHLNSCLTELAANTMHREKMVFRSYSSFYESMLRQQFVTLKTKQKEVERLRDELKTIEESNTVEFNCRIADKTQELLKQIMELKAKCVCGEKQTKLQETRQSEAMKRKYDGLVHRLFSSSTALKGRFEEYRTALYGDMISSVRSVRSAAIDGMKRIRRKAAADPKQQDAESNLEESLLKADCDVDIQRENALLTEKLLKLRAVNSWHHSTTRSLYGQQLSDAQEERDEAKTDLFNFRMQKDEEMESLQEQIAALRTTLQQTESRCQTLEKQLNDERKLYAKRLEQLQEMNSQPRVDRTRKRDIDQMSVELENHKQALRAVSEQREVSERRSLYEKSRSQKTARQLQQQLEQERSLKREAFHLVSGLQEKVSDFENSQYVPVRVIQSAPAGGRKGVLSPYQRSFLASRPSTKPAGLSARSSTPDPTGSTPQVKLQRPKTSAGQLRTRLAESLMSAAPSMGSFGEEEVRVLSEGNLLQ